MAGTGDHTFERRLRLGGPLLKENIATMVLERLESFSCHQLLLEAEIKAWLLLLMHLGFLIDITIFLVLSMVKDALCCSVAQNSCVLVTCYY